MQLYNFMFAALALLFVAFCPTSSTPMPALAKPEIAKQGRDFNSRFAPALRPVFPRSFYPIEATRVENNASPVEKRDDDYADYVGPTASGHHKKKHHHHPW